MHINDNLFDRIDVRGWYNYRMDIVLHVDIHDRGHVSVRHGNRFIRNGMFLRTDHNDHHGALVDQKAQ